MVTDLTDNRIVQLHAWHINRSGLRILARFCRVSALSVVRTCSLTNTSSSDDMPAAPSPPVDVEAEYREIEYVDEGVDGPNLAVLADVVVDAFRRKRILCPVQAFDEARHQSARSRRATHTMLRVDLAFSHRLSASSAE